MIYLGWNTVERRLAVVDAHDQPSAAARFRDLWQNVALNDDAIVCLDYVPASEAEDLTERLKIVDDDMPAIAERIARSLEEIAKKVRP